MPSPTPVESPKEVPAGAPRARRGNTKGLLRGGLNGALQYSNQALVDYTAQPLRKKGELTREKWSETAYVLAMRAKRASQSYSKKDFNSLYRLILSAGIAFDKAFPTSVVPLSNNVMVALFGSLGDGVRRIVEPSTPAVTIDAKATPVDIPIHEDLPSLDDDTGADE